MSATTPTVHSDGLGEYTDTCATCAHFLTNRGIRIGICTMRPVSAIAGEHPDYGTINFLFIDRDARQCAAFQNKIARRCPKCREPQPLADWPQDSPHCRKCVDMSERVRLEVQTLLRSNT